MEIKARKSLGQNFLINEEIINRIVNEIDYEEDDLIIEIGPGKGALTKYLSKTKASVLCYEIDSRMKDVLSKYSSNKLQIIYADFLKRNIKDDIKSYNYKNVYVIANIPYYITTPIIEHIIKCNINPQNMLLMVQKEVASRLTAKPNTSNYGYITVYLNYYFDMQELIYVCRKNFNPIPNVDSAVVKFSQKSNSVLVANENNFFQLLKDSFHLKRKTLKNNLTNYNWELIKKVLLAKQIAENVRAEALDLATFIEISNSL